MTKILVAEDDAQLNKILCACLSDRGYEATGCPDAARPPSQRWTGRTTT